MPKPTIQLALPAMTGGVNRFESDNAPNQCVDCLDVINDDGDLRRRDAFRSIATAAPHHIATTACTVVTETSGAVQASLAGRATSPVGATVQQIYVGADEKFDGIDVRGVSFSGSVTSAHKILSVAYWNGSAWVTLGWWKDETFYIPDGSSYGQTLSRNGRISWHKDTFRNDAGSPPTADNPLTWATTTVNGVSKYWIRLLILNGTTGALTSLEGTVNIVAPGISVHHYGPIRALFPVKVKSNRALLIGSDRVERRGRELGAKLGLWSYRDEETKEVMLVEDEGAGVVGSFSFPSWEKNGVSMGTSGSVGSSGTLTKLKQDYNWANSQFFGAPVLDALVAHSSSTSTVIQTASPSAAASKEYERLLLAFTSGSLSGLYREIVDVSSTGGRTSFTVAEGFSGAPSAGDTFKVVRIAWVRTKQTRDKKFFISNQGNHTLTINANPTWASPFSTFTTGQHVHWEVVRELEWALSSGRWSSTYDPITGLVYLTNGESGLLTFDGVRLRRAVADYSSDVAEQLTGLLPDRPDIVGGADPTVRPDATLHTTAPSGKYIVDFSGRLVVGGFRGRDQDVQWSAPGGANNIWPRVFTSKVRDHNNDPITGLASMGDRLFVFTRTAVHQGLTPDDRGMISFQPITQGVGSMSHAAIGKIAIGQSNALIFPGPDGVYILVAGEPTSVIDDWKRVIEGGVNEARLGEAVATVLAQRKWYVLALSSKGSSVNDRVIVFDYGNQRSWVWSAPYGISALATEINDTGAEVLLAGTEDGFVSTLLDAPDDDGRSIDSFAKTSSLQPFEGRRGSFQRVLMTAAALGSSQTMECKIFLDRREEPFQTAGVPVAAGKATLPVTVGGTTPYLEDSYQRYGSQQFKTAQFNLRQGAQASLFQLQIGGTNRWRLRSVYLETRPLGSNRR